MGSYWFIIMENLKDVVEVIFGFNFLISCGIAVIWFLKTFGSLALPIDDWSMLKRLIKIEVVVWIILTILLILLPDYHQFIRYIGRH